MESPSRAIENSPQSEMHDEEKSMKLNKEHEEEIYYNGNGHGATPESVAGTPEGDNAAAVQEPVTSVEGVKDEDSGDSVHHVQTGVIQPEEQSMLIVMTAVNPNDLEPPNAHGQPSTTTTMSIMLPADEFLISSAQLNEERRRKELGLLDPPGSNGSAGSSQEAGSQQQQAGAVYLTASAADMAELQEGAQAAAAHAQSTGRSEGAPEESWRAYYEHPLTAATSAMLNISGAGHEDPQTTNMGGFIYEYYKPLQQLPPGDKDALVGLTKSGAPGGASAAAAAAVAAAAALGDLWPNAATNPALMTSHHHKSVTTNGLSVGGVAGLLVAPPSSSQQSSTSLTTPASSNSAGSAASGDYSPSVTPAPPSSAPPSASPRNLEQEGQGSPRARSTSPELHGLFASPANTQVAHLQQLQLLQQYSIKREPEDLSQPLTRKHLLLQDRDKLISQVGLARGAAESVLVLGRKAPSNTVVVVKDEFRSDRESPEDGSTGLLLKTPLAMTTSAPSSASPTAVYASQIFANLNAHTPVTSVGGSSPHHFSEHVQYTNTGQQGYVGSSSPGSRGSSGGPSYTLTSATDAYYRDYFAATESPYQLQRQTSAIQYTEGASGDTNTGAAASSAFVERYVRQSAAYKTATAGSVALTVDLPSPDSGIGTDAITPRDQTAIQQSFDYTELCQAPLLSDPLAQQRSASANSVVSGTGASTAGSVTSGGRSRPWHDFGRQNDADKVQIPKVYNQYGFKYYLETPISTSQRREDDRITYINKGQFYGITLEYVPDPETTLKCQTVKSVVMLMFREEKSPEDEIKAWQFWHGRQHSVKQRILDADTKNSVGLVGCIEEVAHNAIAVYWNPLESSAKINVAVQCLSTDFSSQKGVKGLPLHLQIDTYEDPREGPVAHRGYSQIKVFCDKGAERKTRDEERRAAKRKMTATGRKKLDELYHPPAERSEFYSMSDLAKPPVLFSPAEDIDKLTSMELGFYGHETDSSSLSNGDAGGGGGGGVRSHVGAGSMSSPGGGSAAAGGGYLLHGKALHHHHHPHHPTPTTLKFHNHFPPEHPAGDKKDVLGDPNGDAVFSSPSQPPLKRPKLQQVPSPSNLHHPGAHHLGAVPPPLNERVMLYVRQDNEDIYTPLHVVPPSTTGLLHAIESKYKISTSAISNLYRKNRRGIIARLDDDMLRYYCNEDLFVVVFKQLKQDEESFDVTLCEVDD